MWWCGDSCGNWLIKGMLINIRGVGGGGEVWFKSLSKASLYKLRSLYAISRHLHRLDGLNSRASPRTITFLDLGFFVCLKTVCGVIIRPSAPLCVRGLIDIGSGVFFSPFFLLLSLLLSCVCRDLLHLSVYLPSVGSDVCVSPPIHFVCMSDYCR